MSARHTRCLRQSYLRTLSTERTPTTASTTTTTTTATTATATTATTATAMSSFLLCHFRLLRRRRAASAFYFSHIAA